MPIKKNFSARQIQDRINARLDARKQALIGRLFAIAEECLNNAKSNHKYLSRTGNLASSINYCIVDNGVIITAGQWRATVGTEGNGQKGIQRGMQYLQEVVSGLPQNGLTFVMVAGMPYASYVEAMSLDVLDTSEAMAKAKIKQMIEKLTK